LRETAVGKIGGAEMARLPVEAGLKILGTRFTMQVKTCGERREASLLALERSEAFRRPWYTAVVGAVVAAAAGLLGALASLVLRGGTQ